MSKQRVHWMDFERGIFIFLVVFFHAAPAITAVGFDYSPAFKAINDFFLPFRMSCLMFLSGMLLHKSLGKSFKPYVWGKFALIFWPFLIWSMVVYTAEGRLTLEFILKTPISAPSFLWYLWFLFAYYILALGLRRFSLPLIPIIVGSLILSAFLPEFLRMDRFAFLFAFFLSGHLVIEKGLAEKIPTALGLAALGVAIAGGLTSAFAFSINYNAVFAFIPFAMIIAILWAARYYRRNTVSAFVEWVGRNSIVFYVVHLPAHFWISRALVDVIDVPSNLFYILVSVSSFLVAVLFQVARQYFAPVAALFDLRVLTRRSPRLEQASS